MQELEDVAAVVDTVVPILARAKPFLVHQDKKIKNLIMHSVFQIIYLIIESEN